MKTYSTNFLAEAFEVDRASATRALRDVAPDQESTKDRPTYKISTFAKALELHHLKNASNNDGSEGASETSSLTAARIRIANANATAKERDNDVAAGLLCPVGAIANDVGILINVLHENLLALPGKIADGLSPHTELDRGDIMRKVQLETYDYMNAVQRSCAEITERYCKKLSTLEKVDSLPDRKAAPQPIADAGNGNGHE
jgi:hypothetical protein